MREVKEKSSLKARAVETLKSAPQAAFRRGADASFQQLRQELREAAQDGKSDDRYESGKITDTADHAVQEARHLAEKAVHKLPKTKSEPQREARTESVPQHEQPRHPLQPTAAPREYPPQSQSQGNQSVRESASPIREKPVSPVNVRQPKTREYTPDAKASVSPSQYPTPRIHENAKAVSAETMPSTMEHSARESVSPIKEKSAPPANTPQPKMREQAPDAKAPASPSRYPVPRVRENAKTTSAETIATTTGGTEKHEQPAHHLRTERAVRESVSPIKEKPVPPANTPQPKMREYAPNADVPVQQPQRPDSRIHERPQTVRQSQTNRSVRELETSVREKPAGKAKPAEQRPLAQVSSSAEPSAPATAPTVQPAAQTLPREKPPVSSLREAPAALKPDTTQFALPEIKTKEYIRKKRQKQNFLKEESSGIENTITDSETFSPVIRTRETVREQQNSTFPIVRSRSSQPCRRSEHGSRRQLPCPPI